MAALHIQRQNYRAAGAVRDRRVLLHVPTTSIFELDRVADDLLAFVESRETIDAAMLKTRFDGTHAPGAVCDALADFVALGVVAPQPKHYEIAPRAVTEAPLDTLVLTLTTGCNLGCSYCYREDLEAPKAARVMDEETARAAIDLLLRQAGERERVGVVFFGGEPLTRFASIRALTLYATAQGRAAGKRVDFSLTTNATLLDDEMIAFFAAHAFGIAVSMDGDELAHDRRRITLGGKGTYQRVAANVKRLLAARMARPVGVRVTLSRGNTDVEKAYRHLHDELGFASVGFAPVTASADSPLALDANDMRRMMDGMKALGRAYVDDAKRGQRHGFANMEHMLLDLARGTRKVLPCGAGLGLLAAGTDGSLSLCHRFTGTGAGSFGDVSRGIDLEKLGAFVVAAQEPHAACRACPARGICAGGCYHEAYVRTGDPLAPTFAHCDFVREWLEFGLACFGEIAIANPAFFAMKNMEQRQST
ncbi:MAG: quinohemoprotein amine dehydrogenase maturation protein [Rhodocyclaceae bacterium]|nr:quinohemoprotein amine dehydrogenase maturation protein [Rhodocyclaceae bacterium]